MREESERGVPTPRAPRVRRDGRDGVDRFDRAVSTTVSYVLALTITSLLVSGLLTAGGGYVDAEREQVSRDGLGVAGERLAAGISDADRLASTADAGAGGSTVRVRVALPDRVAGADYAVEVVELAAPADRPDTYELRLSTDSPRVTVRVRVQTDHPLATGRVTGGSLVVRYDPAAGELALTSDPL